MLPIRADDARHEIDSDADRDEDIKQCEVFLILHHPRTNQLLLRAESGGFQLPSLVIEPQPMPLYFQGTDKFLPQVQRHFDSSLPITLLRCLWYKRYNKKELENDRFRAIVVLESHGETLNPPAGTEWMDYSCTLFPQAAIRDAKSAIDQFVHECRTGIQPTLRPLFARRGWYDTAVQWMKLQLSSNGYQPIVQVTQMKCSYRGTVLKATTGSGVAVYLKCSPHFTNEASIYVQLIRLMPKFVARPIAVDIERRLLLMRDHGKFTTPFDFDDSELVQWSNELAEIHQSTVGKDQELLDAGLRLLTLDVMEIELDNVLAYAEQTQLLNSQIINQLHILSEEMRRDCRDIKKLGIPSTFVHGDLYFSNIYRKRGTEVSHGICDFGESTISHPFIDLLACGRPHVYAEKWIDFVATNLPDIAPTTTKETLLACNGLCSSLFGLWEAVRLYKEMKAGESPPPPGLLTDLRRMLLFLLRTYDEQQRDAQKQSNLVK